ncbi:DUF3977 domain-containing protein [Paenibacillus sp. PK3_47]|uniref:DUF3977 family protein n=1 Tax=Paenibacillus sp. PK3_47 TaxID=2072642 RepID=UPI00201D618D|nr:DUF3977 family protein [Paenibacillus sp. PK3_47]UQZ37696.1 DUF3977 domain-containing protein [Paenibacillus sp. PK3_47]
MKYIEFGIGNTWIVRTETELPDGTEFEERGIAGPVRLQSVYIRIWIGKSVWIADSREGFKRARKKRNAFKLIFGISSH